MDLSTPVKKKFFHLLIFLNFLTPAFSAVDQVVLVTIDTWRWDAIGASGAGKVNTPVLDSFANQGLYCKKAWAASTMTTPSHASLLTGLNPYHHGIRDNHGFQLPPRIETLAEMMKKAGYATAAFISAFPLVRQYGLNQGFDLYEDTLPSSTPTSFVPAERRGEDTLKTVRNWLQKSHNRFFLWVHFYEPHYPYVPPASYRNPEPYFGEVAYVDYLVGELRKMVESKGSGGTIWVLSGDHGEALGDHGESTHGIFVYDSTARVPLIFWGPGNIPPGKIINARLVDVVPTLAELCHIPIRKNLDGRSLLKYKNEKFRTYSENLFLAYTEAMYPAVSFGAAPLRALSDEKIKVIDAPRPEAYDLLQDPLEKRNLFDLKNERISDLYGRLKALRTENSALRRQELPSKEEQQGLASLGYTGSGGEIKVKETGMDPKEFLFWFEKLQKARNLFSLKRRDEALPLYRDLMKMFPQSPTILGEMGLLYALNGNAREAEKYLLEAWNRQPDATELALALGNLALQKKDFSTAEKFYLECLVRNPNDVEANLNLGILYAQHSPHPSKAIPYWRKFLELAPGDPEAPSVRKALDKLQP